MSTLVITVRREGEAIPAQHNARRAQREMVSAIDRRTAPREEMTFRQTVRTLMEAIVNMTSLQLPTREVRVLRKISQAGIRTTLVPPPLAPNHSLGQTRCHHSSTPRRGLVTHPLHTVDSSSPRPGECRYLISFHGRQPGQRDRRIAFQCRILPCRSPEVCTYAAEAYSHLLTEVSKIHTSLPNDSVASLPVCSTT